MAKQKTSHRAKEQTPIEPNQTFLLIHGYTGSPTDFNGLPEFLRGAFAANVVVPMLPGHGTKVEDLDGLQLNDFIVAAENELKKLISRGDRIILGGHSLGAEIALCLAARYPVSGVFTSAIPYRLKFPFSIPALTLLGYIKKYWPKKLPKEELERRKTAFYYNAMPWYGLKIVHEANHLLRGELSKITCPLLTIQSRHEHISDEQSHEFIHDGARSSIKEALMLENRTHGVFYSGQEEKIYSRIADFVKRHSLFS